MQLPLDHNFPEPIVNALKPWMDSLDNRRIVFVDSMSDLFHDDVPPGFIAQVFEVIRETPQHTYQVLTKRAQRLSRIAPELDWPPNLWMGVSVETRRYGFRIDHLRQVPAAVRFVSAEPLLGPLGELGQRRCFRAE